jgi:molybdate transport system substrate-binding protein
MFSRVSGLLFPALFLLIAEPSAGDDVRVGVASNFAGPARELAARYESRTGHTIRLSTASTGKLYAQLRAGAPFEVFLAADDLRPARLEQEGLASQSRVYASGRLAVVSAEPELKGQDCQQALEDALLPTVAIANPATAPYGKAALDWLEEQLPSLELRLVKGDNVGQAMSFVASGNARFGIVAVAQLAGLRSSWPGCIGELPADSHPPVNQAAALATGAGTAAAGFYDYLFSPDARDTIERWGYGNAAD